MLEANRRDFAKAAVMGAGVLASGPLLAQAAQPGVAAQQQQPAPPRSAGADGGNAPPLAPPDKQPPDLKVPKPVRKAGYAIVGLGELALEEVMPAFGAAKMSKPTALVSGHPDKARQVAQVYGIDAGAIYDYRNFERIRDNPAIDIVYIILPNSLHAEFTVRALEASKHVLCEKPMAVTPAECQRMIAAARAADRQLMIAYRLHYEPHNLKVAELCRQRALGKVKTISSSNVQTTKAPNIRLSEALGGGPVSDTGIYSINACRYVTNEEPVSVTAVQHQPADDPSFREVPESVAFTLRYPSGVIAQCDTSFGTNESRRLHVHCTDFGTNESRRLHVHCTDGTIDLDPAFSYKGIQLRVKRGNSGKGEVHDDRVILEAVDQFAAEMDHFSDCVLNGKPVRTPGELGLADVRIVEAVKQAARSGRPVTL